MRSYCPARLLGGIYSSLAILEWEWLERVDTDEDEETTTWGAGAGVDTGVDTTVWEGWVGIDEGWYNCNDKDSIHQSYPTLLLTLL